MATAIAFPSDEALIGRVQQGEFDLIGVLYERHSSATYTLCFQFVRDPDTAQDLVQESFLRLLRYRDNFRGDAKFSTWLFSIVRNVCLDHIAKKGRESKGIEALIAKSAELGSVPPDDSELSPVVQAFGKLKPEQQTLLMLSRIDGVGYTELAGFFDVAEGTIRVRVHRALRRLRDELAELEGRGS